jgi:flavin-dependent dehydrogenase
MKSYDAAIIGGGPAGSTAALSLARRGWKVCIFEATAFDDDRCGETLPPEINPLLRELDLAESFQALHPLESPGIVSVWNGSLTEQDFIANPRGPGWHVDRNRFDRMLFETARSAGAWCIEGCRAVVEGKDGAWWRIGEIAARVLIDASGPNGLPIHPERDVEDRLIVLVMRFKNSWPDHRALIETAADGWWYSAPLPNGEAVAMFFTDCETYAHPGIVPADQLRQTSLTRHRLSGAEPTSARVVYASSSCRRAIAGGAWLATGDSAYCCDPLSGMGVFKALRQATNSAIAADGFLRGEHRFLQQYAALIRADFDAYLSRRRAHYAPGAPSLHSGFWSRRAPLSL